MAEDRRKDRRGQIPAVHVIFDGPNRTPLDCEVRDIGKGGFFVKTRTPLAAGKRTDFQLRLPGEATPIVALGRVVWARPMMQGDDRPAGMAVKFIDVDDGSL